MIKSKFPIISIDTEYNRFKIPFIGTTTNSLMESELFDLRAKKGRERMREICESPQIEKVFHAITNDVYALSLIGIDVVPPYHCTLVAGSLINENFASLKLKTMAKTILGETCDEEKALSKVKAKLRREAKKQGKVFDYEMIPTEIIKPYAIKDTEYTIKLFFYFSEQLKAYKELYDFELSLVPIIVRMQQVGMPVNREFCKQKSSEFYNKKISHYKKLLAYIKKYNLVTTFPRNKPYYNPASPKQVKEVVEQLGLDIKLNHKGDISTDMKTLQTFRSHPFIHNQLMCRFYEKQRGTYYSPLLKHYTSKASNRAHFSFYQSGTKTGRFSAELIQTIPKMKEDRILGETREVRKAFICPPGYMMFLFDYNQIEMRLFIHYAKCKLMADKVKAGYDPHIGTAYDIFGKKYVDNLDDNTKKAFRDAMKDTNFGIIFGMGANKLLSQLKHHELPTTKNPHEILRDYYKKYPVREFMQQTTSMLYKTGVITISFDSSLMKFTRDYRVPQDLAYKGTNVIIQGTAAYVMKYGMQRVDKLIKKYKLGVKMFMTVHDELGFFIKKDLHLRKTVLRIKRTIEDHVTFDLPMTVSVKCSKNNWGEAKTWES